MAKAGRVITEELERPRGSRIVQFGDVVENVNTNVKDPLEQGIERYVGLDNLDSESLRIERWGNVGEGTTFTRRFMSGQVLFGKRRAYQRKAAVAAFEGVCSGDILVFEAKGELIADLLPFIVSSDSFFEHALRTSAGSLSPRTRWSDLAKYEFDLPPKPQQHRISELLWTVTHTIEAYQAVLEATANYQSAVVEGFLNSKNSADWPMQPCAELLVAGPSNGLSPGSEAEGQIYPTLSIGAVRSGKVIASDNLKHARITANDLSKFRLQSGDLLIVRGNGNRSLVGKCGLVDDVPENCFYPDLLIRLAFKPELLIARFACLQWNSTFVQRGVLARAKSTNGIWKINGKDIKAQLIRVPPLEDQETLLRATDGFEETMTRLDRAIIAAKALRSKLLGELLKDRVSV